jgi:subtilisin-like proprotein convertase family protein
MKTKLVLVAAAAAALTASSRPARAQPEAVAGEAVASGSVSGLERLNVRTQRGRAVFHVGRADAAATMAWRDNSGQTDKAGHVREPTAGFELTRRVVVRAEDPARLRGFANNNPGLTVEPVPGVRGFWVLGACSVREAVAVADALAAKWGFEQAYVDLKQPRILRDVPNDPRFPEQWHLKNELDPLFDVNVEPAWGAGYTGAGVVIGIVEDAWQQNHPDLAANFFEAGSQPGGQVTAHATSCAGVAAEVGDNGVLGTGIAYGAWLSSQLFGSDTETAAALAYRNDLNDIKSNSWGPPDVGNIYYMPPVVRAAIEESIATGRGGLGEVFVWAAGNGGSGDRVDYDPYASSRFTIAVAAIGDHDVLASYTERGSSVVVVAHSSGNDRRIHTTTSGGGWTTSFGGTSAASPLAAGVVALMLEARPDLTWRDVQHVLIESARKNDPNHPGWQTNGSGFEVNYWYGFGAVDAGAAVTVAQEWVNVPHEVTVDTGVVPVERPIPDDDPNGVVETASVAENIRIETVELILNVQTTFVGDLEICLDGPSGTRSVLTKQRSGDFQDDYVDYVFTSFRHWGEQSAGDWAIRIADRAGGDAATWVDYRLVFYGTPVCPGDLDGSGDIGVGDLFGLLPAYGAYEGEELFEPAADFDNSGCIDLGDLVYLLAHFGMSCP